ncbi:MAG: AsnC family protein, partial [Pseudomonadota bacterium]
MDSYDVRILDALQLDASMSNVDLADIVHLSASQCSRRRAALEALSVARYASITPDASSAARRLEH